MKGTGCQFPILVRPNGLFRFGTDLQFIFKPEIPHDIPYKAKNPLYLSVQLLRRTNDMGIVLGKLPNPGQPVKHPGPFMAMNQSQFKISLRKISIASYAGTVDDHVRQAVHRFDPIRLLIDLGEIHIFAVVLKMTGFFPQFGFENLGTLDDLITTFEVFLDLEIFQDVPKHASLGVPYNQPGPDLFMGTEKTELSTQFNVIPFFCLFEFVEILLQGLLM